jgi:hypothetical protein
LRNGPNTGLLIGRDIGIILIQWQGRKVIQTPEGKGIGGIAIVHIIGISIVVVGIVLQVRHFLILQKGQHHQENTIGGQIGLRFETYPMQNQFKSEVKGSEALIPIQISGQVRGGLECAGGGPFEDDFHWQLQFLVPMG